MKIITNVYTNDVVYLIFFVYVIPPFTLSLADDATTTTDTTVPVFPSSSSSSSSLPSTAAAITTMNNGEPMDENEDTYDDMLTNIFTLLQVNNPALMDRGRKKVQPPHVSRVGTTRTAWTNFNDICIALDRAPEHVNSFFLAELGTTGAIDGSHNLLLKGRFQPKYIESLLRKYTVEYVICQMCRCPETELTRDPISRLYFMNCKACGSTRSVAPIKAGFHATARGERRKAREATG